MTDTTKQHTNALIHETSPYLLQHAHNPVDWFPWSDEAWEKAKKENKLVLVSIGYSACHWCHVMEHESFEDDSVAKVMNENFICIKVDREQRPDVDGVYMSAVQIMAGSGGWPLNCFTLPDGRPVYGGTYFPKQNWLKVLHTLADLYTKEPQKVFSYADELTNAVKKTELLPDFSEKPAITKNILSECVENWKKRFDNEEGGPKKAPKFPLPNNYQFLLRQYYFTKDESLLKHINLTLGKMAFGGIYDQVGGGFARYSTDGEWKAPHFEKMLYDNAQLVSLYSEAYQLTKNNLYKQIVYETLEFIQREMTNKEGGFYSAMDADSEGEEGKYYVWKKEELKNILDNDFDLFAEYFNVNEIGLWEHDNYILLRKKSDEEIAKKFSISTEKLQNKISMLKKKVLSEREKRIKPGLDNKILTSWNAMMIKGYADAYSVFHEKKFLDAALKNADFILKNSKKEEGRWLHAFSPFPSMRTGIPKEINGFLEDYSFTIEAFIALYQNTFDEKWLHEAKQLAGYALNHFHDSKSVMFYFTSDLDTQLISRKMEIQDNVIPSSNSSMAKSLFCLGNYFDEKNYLAVSEKMLKQVQDEIPKYGSAYSNWAMLAQNFIEPFYEIAIVGNSVDEKRKELSEHFIPNAIFVGSKTESNLPLLQNKFVEGKTLIYICKNKTCKLPAENISEALKQIE
ncbi:MAG: thioredoxin domain-containing protein [Bacteroidetes bacterium]|nr:thioredoxin domain-containing protein [Bacteroidota bacterium]